FFFQAEDGIRDFHVTGVQTCALPISDESYLYIDVGGGSTELTFFSDGKLVFKESFNIGTIRLIKGQVTEANWNEMKSFIRSKTKGHHHVTAIGSGGNINKIFSLSKKKEEIGRASCRESGQIQEV